MTPPLTSAMKRLRQNPVSPQQEEEEDSPKSTSATTPPARRSRRQSKKNAAGPSSSPLQTYIPPYLRRLVMPYHGDFCYTPLFHPKLLAQLMMEGFLPIATAGLVLPKLHSERSVIHLQNKSATNPQEQPLPQQSPCTTALHTPKSVRKKSKRFSMTINTCFDDVVAGCLAQHASHCWLIPDLVAAFAVLHQETSTHHGLEATLFQNKQHGGEGTPNNNQNSPPEQEAVGECRVRLYTIEVWSETEENGGSTLVAGELGYAVGSIYTSLTGFSNQSSAGSVQLAALGSLLTLTGHTIWDLGMDMEYKQSLGAVLVPRDDWVRAVHVHRLDSEVHLPLLSTRHNCRELIDQNACVTGMNMTAAVTNHAASALS